MPKLTGFGVLFVVFLLVIAVIGAGWIGGVIALVVVIGLIWFTKLQDDAESKLREHDLHTKLAAPRIDPKNFSISDLDLIIETHKEKFSTDEIDTAHEILLNKYGA
ncbi:TPA: hypothetical protein DCR79_02305 [Patescibacteria group bacterium]|nr:hypothetical protein [Patescibacteria group bacterium]